jgi:hypothetical protein
MMEDEDIHGGVTSNSIGPMVNDQRVGVVPIGLLLKDFFQGLPPGDWGPFLEVHRLTLYT